MRVTFYRCFNSGGAAGKEDGKRSHCNPEISREQSFREIFAHAAAPCFPCLYFIPCKGNRYYFVIHVAYVNYYEKKTYFFFIVSI
jgi:hypothetical protein